MIETNRRDHSMEPPDSKQQSPASSEVHLFAEQVEALACIDTLILLDDNNGVSVSGDDADEHNNNKHNPTTSEDRDAALDRWRQILDRYLECPTLLDQSLELMVQRLADGVLQRYLLNANAHASTTNDDDDDDDDDGDDRDKDETAVTTAATTTAHAARHALSALYALCKVRGRKIVQKFLPHSVEDLDPVWNALQAVINYGRPEEQASAGNGADQGGDGVSISTTKTTEIAAPLWESVYMLWNWMAVLSLIPFDCAVLTDVHFWPTLLKTAQLHLMDAGPVREAAAGCLAAWLSRPDLELLELPQFIQWCVAKLSEYTSSTSRNSNASLFRVLGILQVLVTILKVSPMPREKLVVQMDPVWTCMLLLDDQTAGNLLLRKYLVKWWTRMSCAYLPPRIAPWRYQRGQRSLAENLEQARGGGSKSSSNLHETQSSLPVEVDSEKSKSLEQSLLFHVPDQVEDAMGKVIEALSHASTIVRWSAAKGVGRITERLPALCAEDVLDAVLEYFSDADKDGCWHGACLTLAELARRGLLLPNRLQDVVPHIVHAVQYDVRRGRTSVGAHVRDAACYTYWAFARAYSPAVLRPYLAELSESIVLTSLFDRQVNCRRAASAAFQEAVGRQGAQNFPHGIAILTRADYFSLGNRNDAYLDIAPSVAIFEEYRKPVIRHLYTVKLFHWDISIRTLASKSLNKLTALDPAWMGSEVIPFLLEKCLDDRNLEVRHGGVLGVAETILALAELKLLVDVTSEETMINISAIVSKIEKNRLYRGRGGEIMRSAVCRLIQCIATAQVPLNVRDQVGLLDTVDASIPHPSEPIQDSACKALESLTVAYFPVGENGPSLRLQTRVVDKFVGMVAKSDNPAVTRGYALALGYLPAKLLAPNDNTLSSVLDSLSVSARHDAIVSGDGNADTRRNALLSLAQISETVGFGTSWKSGPAVVQLSKQHVSDLFETYLHALGDYKTDRRGDVGSWCRMAAMDGLVSLILLSIKSSNTDNVYYDPSISNRIVGALLKQFAEKLDNVRQRAGVCLCRIFSDDSPEINNIQQKQELMDALELHESSAQLLERNWSDPALTFPMVMKAASITAFRGDVFAGIVISVGGLTESVAKHATAAMLEWAKLGRGTARVHAFQVLLELMKRHRREGRVILPLLKTLDVLFTHQCLDELMDSKTDFAETLLSNLKAEEKGCEDVHRLFAIGNVTIGLLSSSPKEKEIEKDALAFLCTMLSHDFPRVRNYIAQQFYVLLLEHPELINDNDSVLDLILKTAWDSADTTTVRTAVDQVGRGLGVDLAKLTPLPVAALPKVGKKTPPTDDFDSYAALVNQSHP
jgi:hypothetical protein